MKIFPEWVCSVFLGHEVPEFTYTRGWFCPRCGAALDLDDGPPLEMTSARRQTLADQGEREK